MNPFLVSRIVTVHYLRRAACLFFILFLLNVITVNAQKSLADEISSIDTNVDLELILAVDCSYSVDQQEYALQMSGIADALRTLEVQYAIQSGKHQRIAVSLIQWSSTNSQTVALPWMTIGSPQSIELAARSIEQLERRTPIGPTSISAVIAKSLHLFESSPYEAQRKVIDISGDGRNNDGVPPQYLRDVAIKKGITINGLAIENEVSTLRYYFRNQIIGGQGSFVIKANSYNSYKQAILEKLVREIGSMPVVMLPIDDHILVR